jgi:hypothetical protein
MHSGKNDFIDLLLEACRADAWSLGFLVLTAVGWAVWRGLVPKGAILEDAQSMHVVRSGCEMWHDTVSG